MHAFVRINVHLLHSINVFGGGLALYDDDGHILGGLGVSGDSSCADHNVAWRVRDLLDLDNVPAGVGPNGKDGLNFNAAGFGHPRCNPGSPGTVLRNYESGVSIGTF